MLKINCASITSSFSIMLEIKKMTIFLILACIFASSNAFCRQIYKCYTPSGNIMFAPVNEDGTLGDPSDGYAVSSQSENGFIAKGRLGELSCTPSIKGVVTTIPRPLESQKINTSTNQPPVNLNSKDDVGMCHALMFVMFEVSQTEEGRLRLSSLPSEEKKQAERLFMLSIGGALRMQSRMDVLLKSASTGQYFEPKHNKYRDRLGVLSEEQRSSFIGKNMPRCLDAGLRAPKSDLEILAEKQKK